MTVIKTFIAEDGTKFNTEWECRNYEDELEAQKFINEAFLYDEDGKALPMTEDNFDKAFYIVTKTDRASDFLAHRFNGCSNPWDQFGECASITPGCWVYAEDGWRPAEDILRMARIIEQIS